MGFFDALLAGGVQGFGKGMVDQADYNDRLEAQRALQQEKQQAALELQRQRADDRLFQASLANESRAARTSGGGGANVFDLIMGAAQSKDPEQQRVALGMIESMGGADASRQVADKVFGRPMTQERSYEMVDALGDGSGVGTASVSEKASYIAAKGAQELQRLYALTANKGEIKNFAEGEQLMGRTDLATAEVQGKLKAGKPLSEATDRFNEVTNSAKINPLGQQYADNKAAEIALRASAAEQKVATDTSKAAALEAKELDRQILEYEKLKKDARTKDREAYEAALIELKARRKGLVDQPAPGKPASNWAPTGSSMPPKLQDSLSRYSQFRQGQAR